MADLTGEHLEEAVNEVLHNPNCQSEAHITSQRLQAIDWENGGTLDSVVSII